MATITVLGAGMMGSALCVPLADRGHDVRLVGTHLDDEIVSSLREQGVHPRLGLALPRTVKPFLHGELERALQGAEAIGLGVSSAGISWAGDQLARHVRPGQPVVMITKGLAHHGDRVQVLPDVLLEGHGVHPAAVGGPCIAGELARRVETCVVLSGRDSATVERLAAWMRTDYYHVSTSADVVGVGVCAALKNAYAMGIAFAAGLHERRGGTAGSIALHNYESAVFAQAVLEMRALVDRLGGNPDTVSGLAGVGNLNVTCNGGRTGRFGRLLGLGLRPQEAVRQMAGATLECVEILELLRAALPDRGVSLPLLSHLMAVALDGAPVAVPFDRFFSG